MSIAEVMNRFAVLAGIDSEQSARWTSLVRDACAYVQAHCTVKKPNGEQTARLEMLSAAYALKLYCMCADDGLTQFVAGDVRLTSSADKQARADSLWRELAENSGDLIHTGGFLFGRVMN